MPETCSGRLVTKVVSTVAPMSEVAVSNWEASALTTMFSVTAPNCNWISSDTVVPVVTVTPSREYFFRLAASTVTE